MFNCYKVFMNGRLYAITGSEGNACSLCGYLESFGNVAARYEGAYIPGGVGF